MIVELNRCEKCVLVLRVKRHVEVNRVSFADLSLSLEKVVRYSSLKAEH